MGAVEDAERISATADAEQQTQAADVDELFQTEAEDTSGACRWRRNAVNKKTAQAGCRCAGCNKDLPYRFQGHTCLDCAR